MSGVIARSADDFLPVRKVGNAQGHRTLSSFAGRIA